MIFITPSLSVPRDQRNSSAPNATVSKRSEYVCDESFLTSFNIDRIYFTSLTLTGVAIGGILATCFAILLLLLVPCYLKRRHRRAESIRANDMEYGLSRQPSFASSSQKAVS